MKPHTDPFIPDSLAVVLFAYNEEGNLLRLLRRMDRTLSETLPRTQIQYALCIQGTDATQQEAQTFQAEVAGKAQVHLHYSPTPLGVRGAALKAFSLVQGAPSATLMMDCDLNHQPEELPVFLRVLQPNSLVVGSRFCRGGQVLGMPLWKRLLSIAFNQMTSLILRIPIRDKTSGYRLITSPHVPKIAREVRGKGFDFYIEFLLRLWNSGLHITEVPICFKVRTAGISKMRILPTIVDYLRMSFRLIRVRSRLVHKPIHLSETVEQRPL